MKTIRVYSCECGEDVYEDDGACLGCGRNPSAEFDDVEIADEVREVLAPTSAARGDA